MTGGPPPLILVVDDADAGRYAAVRVLTRAGFRVIETATGRDALAQLSVERPDVVILDVSLPDMSGLDVCRRIKEDPASASCLVVQVSASFVRPSDAVRGLEAGADAYLTEPLEPTVLVATVNALLRMRRAEDRARIAGLQLAATFDAISEGVCLLDEQGVIRHCNDALATLAGRPRDDVVGQSWPSLTHAWLGEDAARLPEHVGDRRVAAEVAVGHRWIRVTVDPVLRGASSNRGAVCTVSDITEHKRAEEWNAQVLARERAARAEAESANRSKDEFLAVLSHELRTPLTAILGWVRTLRLRPMESSAIAHGLEVIERNTRMQAQLIEDLLDVSRIIAGKLELDPRPVLVSAVVEAALDGVRATAAVQGVRLGLEVEAPGLRAEADAGRLQQVFANLLSNAVKFTPTGGRVDVSVRRAQDRVVVTVRDTGRGIRRDFLPHVFERFQQADRGVARSQGGLGLGLAIVRHLAELHGGTVSAESEGENRGAAFTVSLPALADGPPAMSSRRGMAGDGTARLDGTRVLVVDDNADAREMVAMVLGSAGALARTVSSLAAAEAALNDGPWDVLISDLGMPDGDGYDLIRRVRAQSSLAGLPAVALSAHARDTDARLSIDAGFDVHLPKPIDPDRLVRVVASLAPPRAMDRAG
jgi:PAS domain S-box-containing protein